MIHMTVGALWAILSGLQRGTIESVDFAFKNHPLLCGIEWLENEAVSSALINKNGYIIGGTKITCPECIKVLKDNGL